MNDIEFLPLADKLTLDEIKNEITKEYKHMHRDGYINTTTPVLHEFTSVDGSGYIDYIMIRAIAGGNTCEIELEVDGQILHRSASQNNASWEPLTGFGGLINIEKYGMNQFLFARSEFASPSNLERNIYPYSQISAGRKMGLSMSFTESKISLITQSIKFNNNFKLRLKNTGIASYLLIGGII